MGIPKKRTAQGMFYGVKKLEKPAEAEVENVEIAEKNFSQIAQIAQISEKEFSQIPQITENPEESQDTHSKDFYTLLNQLIRSLS